MKKTFAATLALLAVIMTASPVSAYDRAAWRADYAQLKRLMQQDYANLAWAASPESGIDLPRLDQRTRAALSAARTDAEAQNALEAFVAGFHDGHLKLVRPAAAPLAQKAAEVPRPDFEATDAAGSCAALGFNPGSSPLSFSLPVESLPGFQMRSDGLNSVYRSGVYTVNGVRIGLIRIPHFTMRALPATCRLGWERLVATHQPLTSRSVREAAYAVWLSAFRDTITDLRQAGATRLLIDVGNNSGGDDSGDLFPRFLTDRAVRSAPLLMVASATGARYFDEQISDLNALIDSHPGTEAENALTAARDDFVAGKAQTATPCDLSWVWHEQRSWAGAQCKRLVPAGFAGGYAPGLPRGAFAGNTEVSGQLSLPSAQEALWAAWIGPVYVLTDGQTYSSAEMFAAVMQDNAIGKTVGVTTGGDGCGFMVDAVPPMLTHSRMSLRMPNCVLLRRDGRNEVSGIVPDIPVLPTQGEDSRQRAVRLLGLLATDNTPSR
ncbi:S41 family peptidase [Asticcacaulis sp. DXS10W]|uniref:S41 family peptidase n=1 Tax=Asticcacaulis currens TaxID=2984210 RepID=A0ABT5IG64_9CAUL|nr:S41 family peptidase [Asticcacaulis currens]MDC7695181.1 S41 family peptidase [Asticcacaulis currens]